MNKKMGITVTSLLLSAIIPNIATADYRVDIGMLSQSDIFAEEQVYQHANEGASTYMLDCATDDSPKNDTAYTIGFNFVRSNKNPVSARFSGGENMEVHDYIGKEILIDKQTGGTIYRGIGSLNAKFTRLTLENGEVQLCKPETED